MGRKDGSVFSVYTWIDVEGDRITLNTSQGRVWPKIIDRDPRVTILVAGSEDPYTYAQIRGRVTETQLEGAQDHINQLSRTSTTGHDYDGGFPGEVRIKLLRRRRARERARRMTSVLVLGGRLRARGRDRAGAGSGRRGARGPLAGALRGDRRSAVRAWRRSRSTPTRPTSTRRRSTPRGPRPAAAWTSRWSRSARSATNGRARRTRTPPSPSCAPTRSAAARRSCASPRGWSGRARGRSCCCPRSPPSARGRRTTSTPRARRPRTSSPAASPTRPGVRVLVVRPGFVPTQMTVGRKAPPLSATPAAGGRGDRRRAAAGTQRRLRAALDAGGWRPW